MIGPIKLSTKESVFTLQTSLDGVDYGLRFRWNARVSRWFWRLEDATGAVILGDRKLVCNAPMMHHFPVVGGPSGDLWCVTTTGEDPGLFDLDSRARLSRRVWSNSRRDSRRVLNMGKVKLI